MPANCLAMGGSRALYRKKIEELKQARKPWKSSELTKSEIFLACFISCQHNCPMPTDGTDFARRRKFYGKYYTLAKAGADAPTLAGLGSAGFAREVQSDRAMPMLGAMLDAVIGLRHEIGSGGAPPSETHRRIGSRLDAVLATWDPSMAGDELKSALTAAYAKMEARGEIGISPETQFREELRTEAGMVLLDRKVVERGEEHLHEGCGMDYVGVERFKKDILDHGRATIAAIMESIESSPNGVPHRKFRNPEPSGAKIDNSSPAALEESLTR